MVNNFLLLQKQSHSSSLLVEHIQRAAACIRQRTNFVRLHTLLSVDDLEQRDNVQPILGRGRVWQHNQPDEYRVDQSGTLEAVAAKVSGDKLYMLLSKR